MATFNGTPNDDTFTGGADNDFLYGAAGNDSLAGAQGDDTLDGYAGNDTLDGGDGNDVLRDKLGANLLRGGEGNDTITAADSGSSPGLDGVPGIGSYGDSTLEGGAGNDVLAAGRGNDLVLGGDGNDSILVIGAMGTGPTTVTVDGGAGDDRIAVTPWGYGGAPAMSGTVNASGGAGSDTYVFSRALDKAPRLVIKDFQAGAGGDVLDALSLLDEWRLFSNPFDRSGFLRLVQDGADTLLQVDDTGAADGANFVTVAVLQNLNAATLTGANFVQGTSPDGSPRGIQLSGTDAGDSIAGGLLDDTLHGGGSRDWLDGGKGSDVLYGDDGDDLLTDAIGNDSLYGGIGNDMLRDQEGDNLLDGGAGNDTVEGSGKGVQVLRGGDGDDLLIGSGNGRYQLEGGEGKDELQSTGGAGGTLDGGGGNDYIILSNADPERVVPGTVRIDGGAGNDKILVTLGPQVRETVVIHGGAGSDYVELDMFSPGSAITIDDFQAGEGGDVLDLWRLVMGQEGNPFAAGGMLRVVQRGLDTVFQFDADGAGGPLGYQDLLTLANLDKAALGPANIWNGLNPNGSSSGRLLTGTGQADNLAGSPLDDTLSGAAGNDTLTGLTGDDQLDGGDGDDLLYAEQSPAEGVTADIHDRDRLQGGAGNDLLVSLRGSDTLEGGAGNDTIRIEDHWTPRDDVAEFVTADGGDGNDLFVVKLFQEPVPAVAQLSGGAGSDTFRILSTLPAGSLTITDFQAGAGGDLLDLAESVAWTGATPFAGGYLRLLQSGLDTIVQVDTDGPDNIQAFRDLVTLRNVDARLLTTANIAGGFDPHAAAPQQTPPGQGGTPGSDRLIGTAANDLLDGGAGDDSLAGGAGDDLLLGGPGRDTAVYTGKAGFYTARHDAGGWIVADQFGQEGKDTLVDIERAQFSDFMLAFDLDGTAGQAYRLYRAAFDRVPDAGGLGFWIAMMDKGVTLRQVAEGFTQVKEFTDMYGSAPDNHDIVLRLYTNILHRAPDPGGAAFWQEVLDNKRAPLAEVLAAFSESVENHDAVAELIGNGIGYTPYGA